MLLLPALLLCLPLAAQSPWEVLFDGGDTSAWRTATTETFPTSSWVVENGLLRTIPDPVFAQDLWTRHKYRDFELVFEWRVDAGGNTGVKYLIQDWVHGRQVKGRPVVGKLHEAIDPKSLATSDRAFEYTIGYEYQMIDEQNLPTTMGSVQRTAALYDYLPPARPAGTRAGQFHTSKIVVLGDKVEHWLDGEILLVYELHSELLQGELAKTRRLSARLLRELAERDTPIALQHHSSAVAFRNIRIRRLTP